MNRHKATERLNDEQRAQVFLQWDAMNTKHKYFVDIAITSHGDVLSGFVVHPGVWQPDKVSARYHASFLYLNNARLYLGRRALDMGTGTGIQGIAMAMGGAREIICTDISPAAVANAVDNIKKYRLDATVAAIQSDLFERVTGKFDVVTFMHPYFDGSPPQGDTIAASMLDDGRLLRRFLDEVRDYLEPNGVVIMPSYDLAGHINDPSVQGPRFGFAVQTVLDILVSGTIQKGRLKLHELRLGLAIRV